MKTQNLQQIQSKSLCNSPSVKLPTLELETLDAVVGGTPVVPNVIIRPIKTTPPSP